MGFTRNGTSEKEGKKSLVVMGVEKISKKSIN